MSAIDIFHEDKSRREHYYAGEVNWRSYVANETTQGPISSHATPAPGTPLLTGDPNEVTPLLSNLPPNSIASDAPMPYSPGINDNQILGSGIGSGDPTSTMLMLVGLGVAVIVGIIILTR